MDAEGRYGRHFGDHRGHILEDVVGQHGLDDKHVGIALNRLHDAQVIDIAVTVEVEVAEHIGGIVDQLLEFLHIGRLCESGANSLKIKI